MRQVTHSRRTPARGARTGRSPKQNVLVVCKGAESWENLADCHADGARAHSCVVRESHVTLVCGYEWVLCVWVLHLMDMYVTYVMHTAISFTYISFIGLFYGALLQNNSGAVWDSHVALDSGYEWILHVRVEYLVYTYVMYVMYVVYRAMSFMGLF